MKKFLSTLLMALPLAVMAEYAVVVVSDPGVLNLSGGTMTGDLNLGGKKLTNAVIDVGVAGGAAGTTNAITSSGLVDVSALLGAGGGGGLTNFVVVSRTSNWAFASTTWVELPFELEELDDENLFASNDWTPDDVGWCGVNTRVRFTQLDNDSVVGVTLYRNGASFRCFTLHGVPAYIGPVEHGSLMFYNDSATNKYTIWIYASDAAPSVFGAASTSSLRPVTTFWRHN